MRVHELKCYQSILQLPGSSPTQCDANDTLGGLCRDAESLHLRASAWWDGCLWEKLGKACSGVGRVLWLSLDDGGDGIRVETDEVV